MTFIWGFLSGYAACLVLEIVAHEWAERRRPKPKRDLYSELCEGMDALRRERDPDMLDAGTVDYRFLGITGEEEG